MGARQEAERPGGGFPGGGFEGGGRPPPVLGGRVEGGKEAGRNEADRKARPPAGQRAEGEPPRRGGEDQADLLVIPHQSRLGGSLAPLFVGRGLPVRLWGGSKRFNLSI